jgi:hypothetical protein
LFENAPPSIGGPDGFPMLKVFLSILFASGGLVAASLSVLPNSAELSGPEARHQFLAEAAVDGHQEDWTRPSAWRVSVS